MRVDVYFQVVLALTSLWFMRVDVCFPGCVYDDDRFYISMSV